MLSIIYYISGHGYGHTIRSVALMDALAKARPDCFFHIRTSTPPWLVREMSHTSCKIYDIPVDVGTVQSDSFRLNRGATLQACQRFFTGLDSMIEKEAGFAESVGARLIIGDVPPLAFEAAFRAQLPSVALANFTWDWIYVPYLSTHPDFQDIIHSIKEAYRKADLLLRLPFHGEMAAFQRVQDIPLIARRARRSSTEVRRSLGLADEETPLVLIALRPDDLQAVQLHRLAAISGYRFILLKGTHGDRRFVYVEPNEYYYPDLINAADVVVSKLGYGIVADCLAHCRPLVYIPREDFVEHEVLVEGINRCGVASELSYEDFLQGNWQEALDEVSLKSWRSEGIALNGAEVAAEHVLGMLE